MLLTTAPSHLLRPHSFQRRKPLGDQGDCLKSQLAKRRRREREPRPLSQLLPRALPSLTDAVDRQCEGSRMAVSPPPLTRRRERTEDRPHLLSPSPPAERYLACPLTPISQPGLERWVWCCPSFLPLPEAVPKEPAARRGAGVSPQGAQMQRSGGWGWGVERLGVRLALVLGASRRVPHTWIREGSNTELTDGEESGGFAPLLVSCETLDQ